MRIQIIFILTIIILTACAADEKARDSNLQGSILERIPIVYRQNIQQGNVVTQDMIDQLHPGLSQQQVRFIMGTPILIDMFHQTRWDYVYTMTHGWGDTETRMIQIYFDSQDQLEHIAGDLRLTPRGNEKPIAQEALISVPDYQDPNRGILKQAAEKIGNVFDPSSKK